MKKKIIYNILHSLHEQIAPAHLHYTIIKIREFKEGTMV